MNTPIERFQNARLIGTPAYWRAVLLTRHGYFRNDWAPEHKPMAEEIRQSWKQNRAHWRRCNWNGSD